MEMNMDMEYPEEIPQVSPEAISEEIPEVSPEEMPEELLQAQPEEAPAEQKPVKKKPSWKQNFFKDMRDMVVILVAFMLVYVLFFRMVVVDGGSMKDTLVDGDRLLLVSNLLYREPKQGDIIVASKDSFRGGENIIKRIIATEGQTVDIDFITGTVYVDGEALDEPYIKNLTTNPEGMDFPLTVSEGCVFVMGDNRRDSMDSRNPSIGLIDEREILGKVILLIFPGDDGGEQERDFSRLGVIG